MAFIRNGFDDLGFPVKSRSAMLQRVDELTGVSYSQDVPDAGHQCYYEKANDVLFQYMSGVLQGKRQKVFAPTDDTKGCHVYAITFTTQVVDGKGRKGYLDFKAAVEKLQQKVTSITRVIGNFELTKQKVLHLHVLAYSKGYIDSGKVRQANGNEFVKVDKIKNQRQYNAAYQYIFKDVDEAECMIQIHKAVPKSTTTRYDSSPDAPHPPTPFK